MMRLQLGQSVLSVVALTLIIQITVHPLAAATARQEGGAYLWISPATVRSLQQRLNQLGYDAGHLNGVHDRDTQTALRNFQEAEGLEPTGNFDLLTLSALGIECSCQATATPARTPTSVTMSSDLGPVSAPSSTSTPTPTCIATWSYAPWEKSYR